MNSEWFSKFCHLQPKNTEPDSLTISEPGFLLNSLALPPTFPFSQFISSSKFHPQPFLLQGQLTVDPAGNYSGKADLCTYRVFGCSDTPFGGMC